MELLAHFTAEELPGTIAIWLSGIGLGVLIRSYAAGRVRRRRSSR